MPRRINSNTEENIDRELEQMLEEKAVESVKKSREQEKSELVEQYKKKIEQLRDRMETWETVRIATTGNLELALQKMPDGSIAIVLRTPNIKNRILLTRKQYVDELIELAEKITISENNIREKLIAAKEYLKESIRKTEPVEEL